MIGFKIQNDFIYVHFRLLLAIFATIGSYSSKSQKP